MDEIVLQGLDGNHQSQMQVMQYFEQLTSSVDGWKLCAEAFTNTAYQSNDPVRFFCLRVCEHVLKTRYQNADPVEQGNMHAFLLASLHLMSEEPRQDKSYMRNKLAQIISLAFVADYPARWPNFFETFYEVLSRGPLAVDMYLRVLKAIDQEVVDREIVHTPEESQRNTAIKDSMRENCVRQLADSWLYILKEYKESQPEIVCLCLEVVGKYVAWIDITLVANERFVPVLLHFLTLPLLRESACDCIYEILSKGMEPVAKTELVESFFSVLDNTGILNPPEEEEGDFLAKLSKLVCGVGLALITSLQKLSKSGDSAGVEKTQTALEAKIPYLLRFLGDEDDDVSQAASEFAQEYISLLKTRGPLSPGQRKHIEGLLYTIVKKMKYDETYNFEHEGEDEAMFMEYRKQIKVIFNNIAQLDPELVLLTVHNIVTQTLPQWNTTNFRDIEMAITLLYSLAEAVPASHGQHFSGNPTKVSVLQDIMRLLVSSRVSCQGHIIIQLQFFETVVRYDKFFMCEPQHIPDVLVAFLDKRGLRHPSVKVRSRCSYLFSRFVKSLKAHLQPYLKDVFAQLQDLLVLNAPSDSTMNGQHLLISDNDQLFLYETASMLVVSSSLSPEKKQELMTSLLAPIATKFEELLSCLSTATDEKQQTAYGNCIYNAMALASRASKGFSGSQTMKQCGCVAAFTNLLQLFGLALDTPVQRSHVQTGVRQFLHRMVVCLDAEILPFIPPLMTRLLKHPDVRELYDFLPLLNQLIMKFKGVIIPFLSEVLMPLVTTIFTVLMAPADERDQVAASERKLLQRGYFLFLSTIVSNECINVFKTLDMQSVDQVFMSVVQGAVELQDPQSQKHCFIILKKLTEAWGGGSDGVTGFSNFLYKHIVPACIMAPLSPAFDLKDGQTILVLGESASCLKAILDKRGAELVTYLQTDYLPTLHMSTPLADEFCQALQADEKTFRKYLKTFFQKAKS